MNDQGGPKQPEDKKIPKAWQRTSSPEQDELEREPAFDGDVESDLENDLDALEEMALDDLTESDWDLLSESDIENITDPIKKREIAEKKEQKRQQQKAARERREAKQNPKQRQIVMATQDQRGDLITPESQREKSTSGMSSNIKQHPLISKAPQGSAVNLGGSPSESPAAEVRAEQSPELTPSPSAQAQAQAVASATPQMTPTPGK